MKRILTLLFGCFSLTAGFAQLPQFEHFEGKACVNTGPAGSVFNKVGCVGGDTLDIFFDRAGGFNLRGVTNGGFVFGTNWDAQGVPITDATGVHFDSVGRVTVDEVFIWIASKSIFGAPDNVEIQLYSASNVDSLPQQLLGTGTANLAFVDSSSTVNGLNGMARFSVANGNNEVDAPFIVALNYQGTDDTLGMVSNLSGDGLLERRCKQLINDSIPGGGVWASAEAIWQGLIDADPIIIPIVTCVPVTSGEEPVLGNEHMIVHPPSPSPVKDIARIEVELPEQSDLQVTVWDIKGRLLYKQRRDGLRAGNYSFNVDVSSLSAGVYYYTVHSEKAKFSSKFLKN